MGNVAEKIQKDLFELQDVEYKEFQSRLMPNIEKERVIGVRIPKLRKYVNSIVRKESINISEFMDILPHKYYEENNVHAFLIEKIKDYSRCVEALDIFLPYVDNWATCDWMNPSVLGEHLDLLEKQILVWISSTEVYKVRFGIGCLMRWFLDDAFDKKYLDWVCGIDSEEYYINMMIAWYLATALAKQQEAVMPLLTENKLNLWIHNKTIQKAVESNQINKELKEFLKTIRVKKS